MVAALAAAPGLGLTTPGPEPLPPGAAALALPVHSVLAAGERPGARRAAVAATASAPCLAAEVADLLDASLALESAYAPPGAPLSGAAAVRGALPSLAGGYSGTLSRRDRALARVLKAVGDGGGGGGGDDEDASPARCLTGALAAATHPSTVDGRRAALACVAWPEGRALAADDSDGEEEGGEGGARRTAFAPHPAAADPAAVLPGAVAALRGGTTTPAALAASGVLALALRALAARDAGLRWAGLEVCALAADALEAGVSAAGAARAAAAARRAGTGEAQAQEQAPPEEGDPAAAAPPAGPAGPQLLLLLRVLRASIPTPGARLPALVAVFAAEAAVALACPASPGYGPANRALLRAPALALGDVPWLKALASSSGSGGGAGSSSSSDRGRLLALLAAGMRSPADGLIFRRRFVAELLMGGSGSAASAGGGPDPAAGAALAAIPDAAPALAADLAGRAGYVEWLGGAFVGSGDGAALAALATIAAHARATPPSTAGAALVSAAAAVVDALVVEEPSAAAACWPTALRLVADAHAACGEGGATAPPALAGLHARAALERGADPALLLAAVAALPLPSPPSAAVGAEAAAEAAWASLADLAGPVAAAAAAAAPRPAWVVASGESVSGPALSTPAAAFLAWLARAAGRLPPPPPGASADAAAGLAEAAAELGAALGPAGQAGTSGTVAVLARAAAGRGKKGGSVASAGPFGDWRAHLGLAPGL